MPQICKVCVHPRRDTIDAELSAPYGRPLRAIGEAFNLSKDTLLRHLRNHLPDDLEKPRIKKEVIEGDSPTATDDLKKPHISSRARATSENYKKLEIQAASVEPPQNLRKPE